MTTGYGHNFKIIIVLSKYTYMKVVYDIEMREGALRNHTKLL